MGIITNLIRERHEQDWKKKEGELQALTSVLNNSPTDEAREWAVQGINSLLSDGGGKKGGGQKQGGKGGLHPLAMLAGAMSSMNPFTAGRGTKQAVQDVESKRPQQLTKTGDEAFQDEMGRAQAKAAFEEQNALKKQSALDKLLEEQEAKQRKMQMDALETAMKGPNPPFSQEEARKIRAKIGFDVTLPNEPRERNLQRVWVQKSGEPPFIAEQHPETGALQKVNGERLDPNMYALVPPPKPASEVDKGVLGEIESARAVLADPKSPKPKRDAAKMFLDNYAAGTQEKQITAALNRELAADAGVTGFGGGSGGGGGGAASKSDKKGQPLTNKVDLVSADEFLARSLGLITSGRDKFTALRNRRGLEALKNATGLSTEQVYAAIQNKKGDAKALHEAITRYRAYQGLENRLIAHGDILKAARRTLPDAKLKILNSAVQSGLQQVSDPDVNKYLIAVNAVAREYASSIANGFQSRAMLPVSSQEEAAKLIAPSLGTEAIDGIVDQLRIEVKASEEAMKAQQSSILEGLGAPISPKGETAKPAPAATGSTQEKVKVWNDKTKKFE